jgi:hypothetical protein
MDPGMVFRRNFSESETLALHWAREGALISRLTEKVHRDVFGTIENPGEQIIRKLEREGLLFVTEEEPIDVHGEPFIFTPCLGLTEAGEKALLSMMPGFEESAGAPPEP